VGVPLPARSPNLNTYAERWVRAVKEECLSGLILCVEASLHHALMQYVEHYHMVIIPATTSNV
jgi:putative transposase